MKKRSQTFSGLTFSSTCVLSSSGFSFAILTACSVCGPSNPSSFALLRTSSSLAIIIVNITSYLRG